MQALLSLAGRHGPSLLFGGVVVGLAWPLLAHEANPWMGLAVFVFTLGALLKVKWRAASPEVRVYLVASIFPIFMSPFLIAAWRRLRGRGVAANPQLGLAPDRPLRVKVETGQALSLLDATGCVVSCESGAVWMTHEGDPVDITLGKGEQARVAHDGKTLLIAVRCCVLQVGRAAPAR